MMASVMASRSAFMIPSPSHLPIQSSCGRIAVTRTPLNVPSLMSEENVLHPNHSVATPNRDTVMPNVHVSNMRSIPSRVPSPCNAGGRMKRMVANSRKRSIATRDRSAERRVWWMIERMRRNISNAEIIMQNAENVHRLRRI